MFTDPGPCWRERRKRGRQQPSLRSGFLRRGCECKEGTELDELSFRLVQVACGTQREGIWQAVGHLAKVSGGGIGAAGEVWEGLR